MKYQNATQQTQVVSFCFAWLVVMFYALPHAQAQTQNWCVPPDPDYCVSRVCGAGEGDCDPGQCATGLVCVNDVGAQYGLPAHYDVCETRSAGTPDPDYCVHNTCGIGEGDCDPGQCDEGVCVNDVGAQYGLPAHYDVCEAERDTTPVPLTQSKVYWAVDHWRDNTIFQRANFDGSQVETVFYYDGEVEEILVYPARGKIYWIKWSTIYWANLDGSHQEVLLPKPPVSHRRYDIDIDTRRGKLYWTISESVEGSHDRREEILRANWDGSQIEIVPGTRGASNLTVDAQAGKLYWAVPREREKEFRRANVDGSQREILFTAVSGGYDDGLRAMAVDAGRGKVYWSTYGQLFQANLNGSNMTVLFSGPGAPKLDGSGPYDLAVDPTSGTLYWVTTLGRGAQYSTEIRRSMFDGSPTEILFGEPEGFIDAMTLALKWGDNLMDHSN